MVEQPASSSSSPSSPSHPVYYPVSLDVSGRPCLVVGGGPVAARKARGLVACGADVTVIAPDLSPDMEAMSPQLTEVRRRPYREGDASAFRLVISATGTERVEATVHADAEAAGVWVNSADDRAHSTFILPAVHRDGALTVAVSTSGLSPALASWLRARIAAQSASGMGELAELLGDARARLRDAGSSSETDWAGLLDGPLPALVAAGDLDRARSLVAAATRT